MLSNEQIDDMLNAVTTPILAQYESDIQEAVDDAISQIRQQAPFDFQSLRGLERQIKVEIQRALLYEMAKEN